MLNCPHAVAGHTSQSASAPAPLSRPAAPGRPALTTDGTPSIRLPDMAAKATSSAAAFRVSGALPCSPGFMQRKVMPTTTVTTAMMPRKHCPEERHPLNDSPVEANAPALQHASLALMLTSARHSQHDRHPEHAGCDPSLVGKWCLLHPLLRCQRADD